MQQSAMSHCYLFVILPMLWLHAEAGKAPKPLRTRKLPNDLMNYADHDDIRRKAFDDLVPVQVDPHGSWVNFIRHSEMASNRRSYHERKDRLRRKGPSGPMGPQGPQGPRGLPGAQVTTADLIQEFRETVREEAEFCADQVMDMSCRNQSMTLAAGDLEMVPRVAAGFNHRLAANVVLQRKTFLELKGFHRPFGGGAFQRGNVFDAEEGRFTSPRDGIYQFSVNVHLVHEGFRRGMPRRLKKRDAVRLLICIQSLCQKHTSLESISGLESNSKVFTMSVMGVLYLEEGQYTSIFIDNGSTQHITIVEGSAFSGLLIGS